MEILLGVVAPFLLFLNKAVRRSMGWLFFTVSLIIFGVVLNRINVFLVGYNPPYATKAYFPSVGEIAMTFAIVSSILFCYRFFVTFFPILPGYLPATEVQLARIREEREKTVSPVLDVGDPGDGDRLPVGLRRAVQPGAHRRPSRHR